MPDIEGIMAGESLCALPTTCARKSTIEYKPTDSVAQLLVVKARDLGFRPEVVRAAIRTQGEQLLQPDRQVPPHAQP